jgi:hypothetical protein
MSKLPVTVATIQSISIFLVTYSFAKYPIFVHSTVPFTYLSIYLNFQSLFHFFINAFIHFSIFYHFQIYLLFYSFFSSASLIHLCCCCIHFNKSLSTRSSPLENCSSGNRKNVFCWSSHYKVYSLLLSAQCSILPLH